jgi:hypothetical protein
MWSANLTMATIVSCAEQGRGGCKAAARDGSRREVQGWLWPDAAIAGRKGRAQGDYEAAARERR